MLFCAFLCFSVIFCLFRDFLHNSRARGIPFFADPVGVCAILYFYFRLSGRSPRSFPYGTLVRLCTFCAFLRLMHFRGSHAVCRACLEKARIRGRLRGEIYLVFWRFCGSFRRFAPTCAYASKFMGHFCLFYGFYHFLVSPIFSERRAYLSAYAVLPFTPPLGFAVFSRRISRAAGRNFRTSKSVLYCEQGIFLERPDIPPLSLHFGSQIIRLNTDRRRCDVIIIGKCRGVTIPLRM